MPVWGVADVTHGLLDITDDNIDISVAGMQHSVEDSIG